MATEKDKMNYAREDYRKEARLHDPVTVKRATNKYNEIIDYIKKYNTLARKYDRAYFNKLNELADRERYNHNLSPSERKTLDSMLTAVDTDKKKMKALSDKIGSLIDSCYGTRLLHLVTLKLYVNPEYRKYCNSLGIRIRVPDYNY